MLRGHRPAERGLQPGATHARPGIVLIYESGTIGTRPDVLPLSIGDGELAETASCVVPLPEIFSYYLQAGRVDVGFLGAAQIDRYGNLNSTVIGDYDSPTTRLPGRGRGDRNRRARPADVRDAEGDEAKLRRAARFPDQRGIPRAATRASAKHARGGGPGSVITDFGMLAPEPAVTRTGVSRAVSRRRPSRRRALPSAGPCGRRRRRPARTARRRRNSRTLRDLHARTRKAHARPVHLPA